MAVLVAVEKILLTALPPAAPRQPAQVPAARSQSLLFGCSQGHVADAPAHLIVDRASAESAYRLLGRAGPSKPVEVAANAVFHAPRSYMLPTPAFSADTLDVGAPPNPECPM